MALFLVQVVTSGYQILAKVALNGGTNGILFSFYRDAIALVLLTGVVVAHEGVPSVDTVWLPRLMVLGGFGIVANQIFFINGLRLTSPVAGAIMQPLIPIWTLILSLIVGIEKLHIRKVSGVLRILGLLLAAGGSIYMLANRAGSVLENESMSNKLIGSILFFCNTFSMAIFTTFQKEILKSYAFAPFFS